MRKAAATIILLCLASRLAGELPSNAAASRPSEPDRLAAESLTHHAGHVALFPDAPGRTIRLRASLEFAHRLAGDEAEVNRLLADVYRSAGEPEAELDALGSYIAARPGDYFAALRWLLLKRDSLDSAEQRISFCESVISDDAHSAPLKAEALAEMAARLWGKNEQVKALNAIDQALILDPHNLTVLMTRLRIRSKKAADEAKQMLAGLAGSPADARAAITLADLLQSRGLHEQAASFFSHATKAAGDEEISLLAAGGLCDAMLDAGQSQQAMEIIEPLWKDHPDRHRLAFNLIEAYRTLGENDKADKLVAQLTPSYRPKERTEVIDAAEAAKIAWFHLAVKPTPGYALAFARRAAEASQGTNTAAERDAQMLLGAAELKSKPEVVRLGVERLKAIAKEDIYAAAFLAEHFYAAGKEKEGREVLLDGLAIGQGGWAYRRLRALASEHKVEIAPLEGAAEIREIVKQFDMKLLAPAVSPERFVEVSLEPVASRVAPGRPVALRATMTNKGDVRVPLGTEGLLVPTLFVQVVAGAEETAFSDLPAATWPAPRYLQPGQSISVSFRVDKGTLGRMLCERPLDEIELKVTGLLSPFVKGKKTISSVPTISIQPVKITRLSLLSRVRPEKREDPAEAYQEALGWIVYDMKSRQLSARMRAARQVASLLAWVRRIETRDAKPPEPLADKVSKAVVLRMLIEVLKDPAPAVRAELLSALYDVNVDDPTMKYLAPAVSDPSALVRLLAAEVIGDSNTRGRQTIVAHLAKDADELVRLMASAFAKAQ
ncbi:MAG: tetratricopeptide repeat protein [Planctomycetota bacterium]|jgi:tetratricopeptide (TPR) repeat protein